MMVKNGLYLTFKSYSLILFLHYLNKKSNSKGCLTSFLYCCRWFCIADDDTYINVPNLLSLLQKYDHTGDFYLGRPSLNHPIRVTVDGYVSIYVTLLFSFIRSCRWYNAEGSSDVLSHLKLLCSQYVQYFHSVCMDMTVLPSRGK